MTDEPDYKKMYDELKTQFDAINSKIETLNTTINDKDKKISQLQIYIADNIVSKTDDTKRNKDNIDAFDDIYNKTLSDMKNKKD